jgi:multidrug resistance efflux pump
MTDQNTPETKPADNPAEEKTSARDPVRTWTFIILALCIVLLAWYLRSDRITPHTSQARVHALVVPIAPEVSGTISSVSVTNNQPVKAGQELFQIETDRYQLALEAANASLESARQAQGMSKANVDAARASLASAEASKTRAEQDAQRMRTIRSEDPGAISERRLESAEASLAAARGQVAAATANVEKALQDLGAAGDQNSRILQAQAAVDEARLNLERTTVRAPDDGVVTGVQLNKGNFASAGAPQMTFVASHHVWLQADFTENNLGHIREGNKVDIVFDVLPGQVIEGTISEVGFGVSVDSAPLGSLPTINNDRKWLRDSQRFPVLIHFQVPVEQQGKTLLKVGSQASATVYTGDHGLFNFLARVYIRILAILTYAY